MFFSHRRQPIVAQLPKKLMGGGGTRNFFFPQRHLRWQFFSDRLGVPFFFFFFFLFFRRKIVLPQNVGGGDIWYCVPHLQNRGGGDASPPPPSPRDFRPWYFRYFVGTNVMLVGLHYFVPTNFQMYRQNSENALLGGNRPPPLATLVCYWPEKITD